MKIGRIILKGMNNFDFDYTFKDDWDDTVPDNLLLVGPNGCGKTTILSIIAELWNIFGTFLENPDPDTIYFRFGNPSSDLLSDLYLPESRQNETFIKQFIASMKSEGFLAAIKIENFTSDDSIPLWISIEYGASALKEELEKDKDYNESYKIKIGRFGMRMGNPPPTPEYNQPYFNAKYIPYNNDSDWIEKIRKAFIKNRYGNDSNLPNILSLESENRQLSPNESKTPEKEIFKWLAVYKKSSKGEGNIENYLFNLKAVDPEKYDEIITEINKFLTNKSIDGFDKKTGALMIETNPGKKHPIHLLSSGERQILLITAFIAKELRPGGILLIDEPDLHLHTSLINGFIGYLKRMIKEKKGQLIIASHFPAIWDLFSRSEKIELGPLALCGRSDNE